MFPIILGAASVTLFDPSDVHLYLTQEPRVIVVDDDPAVVDILERLLTTYGYRAEGFHSAESMLETLSEDDVGCVVTDLQMPGMNGTALQLRLRELNSCLAVIVITGHADVPKAVEVMSLGAAMLLEKPFKNNELIQEVRHAIELSRQSMAKRHRIQEAVERVSNLDEEELEIMLCAARGLPNKAIANQLSLSPRTVDRRRQSALLKLGAVSVADFAVLYAAAHDKL
jgi:two-component system, LuxR family, response regulator FixJ